MDEEHWLSCTDPTPMLEFLRDSGRMSERKLRLLICVCCRHVWPIFQDTPDGKVVEMAEGHAEGLTPRKQLRAVRRAVADRLQEGMGWREEDSALMLDTFEGFHFEDAPSRVAGMTAAIVAARSITETLEHRHVRQALRMLADIQPATRKDDRRRQCKRQQCHAIRDLAGKPFRAEGGIDPAWLAWNARTVRRLAEVAYQERLLPQGTLDPGRPAGLADALEESGCGNEELLGHLRGPGPHYAGCWAVDLLSGRE
jgi:hypothetical protein